MLKKGQPPAGISVMCLTCAAPLALADMEKHRRSSGHALFNHNNQIHCSLCNQRYTQGELPNSIARSMVENDIEL